MFYVAKAQPGETRSPADLPGEAKGPACPRVRASGAASWATGRLPRAMDTLLPQSHQWQGRMPESRTLGDPTLQQAPLSSMKAPRSKQLNRF